MIDLHLHSTASDGTFTPSGIAALGRNCRVLALTDHDTLAGVEEFMAAGGCGAKRIAGVELSIAAEPGYGTFHLLGLGVKRGCAALESLLERAVKGREERTPRILERLAALGVEMDAADVAAEAGGAFVARPHVARALVRKGYAADVKDAFEKYLGSGKPAYVPRWRPRPEDAFAAIHAAGGAAVMAHPRLWTTDPAMLRKGLAALKEKGLDGIEAVYSANTIDETRLHLAVAREFGFAVSAGSDFHGENKPGVKFGMSLPDEEGFLRPLLKLIGED